MSGTIAPLAQSISNGMDIQELKKLLKNSTSVLIMEQGNPDLVIMDYSSYRNLTQTGVATEVAISRASQDAPTEIAENSTLLPTDYNGSWVGETASAQHPPLESSDSSRARESEIVERLNREIMLLKQQIELEEKREV